MASMRITNLSLRTATADDLPGIQHVIETSVQATPCSPEQKALLVNLSLRAVRMLIGHDTTYVAQVSGTIVGCGAWSAEPLEISPFLLPAASISRATIYAVFVHPVWSRRGLGRQIIKTCELSARRKGLQRVILAVPSFSEALPRSRAYQATGMTIIPVEGSGALQMIWYERALSASP